MEEKWQPFPKQERALTIPAEEAFEILYGGSRGGGKTDAGMVWLLGEEYEDGKLYINHPRYRALILRRNYDDLMDWIDRAGYMYRRYGVEIVGKPAEVRWPSGAKFRLGHLKDRSSYEKYLGHEYQRQLIEELTLIPQEEYFIRILGSCRSTIDELEPQVFCTTNPGGVGHQWTRARYVEPAPYNTIFTGNDGKKRIYIPATIEDNPALMADENYVSYLESLNHTNPDLYRAWRHGDWDITAGQFFNMFRRDLHVVKPFTPKKEFERFSGTDWGRRNPFAFLAGAKQEVKYIDPDTLNEYEFNRMWIYKELYGIEKDPHEWARLIKEQVPDINNFRQRRADPSMFHRQADGSRSIADQFREEGVAFMEANNDRIGGWEAVKNWMSIAPDGLPYLLISEDCRNLIQEIPSLMYDPDKPGEEDLDTDGTDHASDSLRYMLFHIKWIDARVGGVKRPQAKKPVAKHAHILDPTVFK